MFITLVWKDWQSLYLYHFHINILHVLFCVCQKSIHCFIIELKYNHVLTDDIKLFVNIDLSILSLLRILINVFDYQAPFHSTYDEVCNDRDKVILIEQFL